MCKLASGASPRHSLELATRPHTKVPWPRLSVASPPSVQSIRSTTFLKWGWCSPRPVSKMATFMPLPVIPLAHKALAWTWSTSCLGMARNRCLLLSLRGASDSIWSSIMSSSSCSSWSPKTNKRVIKCV